MTPKEIEQDRENIKAGRRILDEGPINSRQLTLLADNSLACWSAALDEVERRREHNRYLTDQIDRMAQERLAASERALKRIRELTAENERIHGINKLLHTANEQLKEKLSEWELGSRGFP